MQIAILYLGRVVALRFIAFAALTSLVVADVEARQCKWYGTAPTCKGNNKDCKADEEPVDLGSKVEQTDTKDTLAEFGAPCIFGGFKVLCCKKEAAAPAQKLTPPTVDFCNWYATEAVVRAGQGATCGLTGARWSPNKDQHYGWCIQQKTQQQAWSEHSARLSGLADCAKKAAGSAPPKSNFSVGPPTVTVDADVDIYDKPGGVGTKIGILRKGSKVSLFERKPDQWCGVSGKPVGPNAVGFVWCGKGFELD